MITVNCRFCSCPLKVETISAAMNNRRFHEEQRHLEAKIETDT